MSATADHAEGQRSRAEKLGFTAGQVVQEIGYDEDCDEQLRASIEELTGGELVDDTYEDVVDAVLLWWRDGDGDLVDALVDALTALADGGTIWLLTPKSGAVAPIRPVNVCARCAARPNARPTTRDRR